MRKIFYFIGVFLGSVANIGAQDLPSLKVGDQLNYLIERDGQMVNFDLTLTEVTNGISFSWTMSAPANKSGNITVTSNALKTATTYFGQFKSEDKVLDDQSCMFVSAANVKDLVSNNQTTMNFGGEGNSGIWSSTVDEMLVTYKKNTGYKKAYFLKLENSDKEIAVLPVGEHHILAKMHLHSVITLVSIK